MISTNSANNSKPPATRRHINRLHIGTTFRCPQKTDGGRRFWIRRRECYQGKGLLRGSDRASSDLVANRDQKIPGALFQKLGVDHDEASPSRADAQRMNSNTG
jgi:hypothetical protein